MYTDLEVGDTVRGEGQSYDECYKPNRTEVEISAII